MILDAEYWDQRYHQNDTGWDIGSASPALTRFIDTLTNKHSRILIPGCGNAYEAAYLLEHGFSQITVLDISVSLTDKLRERWKQYPALNVVCVDFFEHQGTYDIILEQTFFCALEPKLRPEYVKKMKSLLKEGGRLAGLLFNREFAHTGPPFGGSEKEYRTLFENEFKHVRIEPCLDSIEPRKGSEVFFEAF